MKSESRPCHSAPAMITYGQSQEPGKNDSESDGCTPGTKKKYLYLRPVMPFSSGEGLPYAPVDWPCPGDNWRWKVGRRISKTGFFVDRFLYLPGHLQKPGYPKQFAGRKTLEQYIGTEFPAADVDAFFASFSWMVRGHMGDWSTANTAPRPRKKGPKDEEKEWDEDEVTTHTSARKRKKPAPVPSTCRRRTRQSFKRYFPSTTKHEVITIDLTEETETSLSLTKDLGSASNIENDEVSSNQNSVSSDHCSIGTPLSLVPCIETVMDVREEPLVEKNSHLEYHLDSTTQDPSSSVIENERVEAQMKLSSILAMDFPLLISTENLTELTILLARLQEDPHLKLHTIEQISLIGKYFLEAKQDMEADECFADLETNIANLICLNKTYKQSKEKVAQVEAEIDSSISTKQNIEDQMTQFQSQCAELQSRCAELDTDVRVKIAVKNDLLSAQRDLAESLSSVEQQVELGKSRRQELELKEADAAKRVADILAKYAS